MVLKLGVAVSVLAVSVFAGCVGSTGSTNGSSAPTVAAGPAGFDDTTGGVEGTVTDTELQALTGAQIGLLTPAGKATEFVVLADPGGAYSLSRVAPGEYQVAAQALGYVSVAKKIMVAAGQVTKADLSLEKLPSDAPFYWPKVFKAAVTAVMVKLTPQCMYNIGGQGSSAKTCQGERPSCDPSANCEVHFAAQPLQPYFDKGVNWSTIMGEVTWASQSAATGKGFMFDLTAPNTPRGTGGSIDQSNPHTFFKMQPKPPIIWRIEPSLLAERKIPEGDYCCDWFYRLFGGWCDLESGVVNNCETIPDYGIANANAATIYMTIFFKGAAPPGFSALPDK